jgi:DNA-binding MarR family transcriptional regulator
MLSIMSTPTPITVSEIRQGVLRLARLLRNGRAPDALSLNKLSVLSNLHRLGPLYAGELAACDNQQPQALTRVLAALEHDRLIVRATDKADGRRSLVNITTAGREALAREMAERDVWLSSALAELTETEREVMRLAARLMARLGDK